MASLGTYTNGQFSVMSNTRAYPYIYVNSVEQDIVNNRTLVRAMFGVARPNTAYWVVGDYDNTPTVQVSYGWRATPVNFAQYGNNDESVHIIDRWVSHNPDGTGSVYVQWDGDLGTGWGTHSFGASYTLDRIPRQASVTSSADLTIGNNLSYTLKNDGSLYVKLIYYVWNGSSYDTVFTSNRGTGTSGTITLGTTENNIMYGAMPNNTSRACILRARTYSDSGYTTQVGSDYDKAGTIYVNQTTNKPTFTTYTVGNLDKNIANTDKYSNVLVTSSTSTLLGADTKMIKGYSKLRAVITSANKMVALNSATGIKYRFTVGSAYDEQNYSADSTVNLDVDNATTNSVSVTAYDSRSLTTTVTDATSITNNANYVPVSLWGLTLTRDNGVDSETKLAFSGSYWKEYFGGGTSGVQNTITAHYRYKETTATWGSQTWNSLTLTDTSGALSFDDYINGDLGASGFDVDKSFNIEVRIYDKLTNYILEGTLNVGTPVIDITSDGIAIKGKYDATVGGSLQVDGRKLLDWFYPVGTIYETTSTDLDTTTKMGNYFGGTWEAYGSGRVLVAKSTDTEFDTIGETGGAKDVTLTSAQSGVPAHNHGNTGGQSQSHTHNTHVDWSMRAGTGGYGTFTGASTDTRGNATDGTSVDHTHSVGNNTAKDATTAHTNLQPYIVVYRYRRTA